MNFLSSQGHAKRKTIFPALERDSDQNRHGQHAPNRHAAIRQQPVNQQQRKHRHRDRGDLEDHQRQPGRTLKTILSRHEFRVHRGQQNGSQRETAAKKNQKEAEDLIPDVAAILAHSPGAIQRHFQRLENSVGGEQQQEQRRHLISPMIDLGQVADDEVAEVAGKIVAQRQNQRFFRGGEMKNVAHQRQHHDQEGEKAQQHAGADRQRVNVHFRLRKITDGGPPAVDLSASIGSIAERSEFSAMMCTATLLTYMVAAGLALL